MPTLGPASIPEKLLALVAVPPTANALPNRPGVRVPPMTPKLPPPGEPLLDIGL
jgi:hypothetical protein